MEFLDVKQPKESLYFGNKNLSDVVLLVEGAELHVHKMALASRSTYFATMFYGEFKEKGQVKIPLKETDFLAFRRVMECVYGGAIGTDAHHFTHCKIGGDSMCEDPIWHQAWFIFMVGKHYLLDMWQQAVSFLETADFFDFGSLSKQCLENLLTTSPDHCGRPRTCVNRAWKMFLALNYDMNNWKDRFWVSKAAVLQMSQNLEPLQPRFQLTCKDIRYLLTDVRHVELPIPSPTSSSSESIAEDLRDPFNISDDE